MKFETKKTTSLGLQKRMQRHSQKGFTLIELLISMTITLVIVGLLMGMTKMAVGAWQTTHAKSRSSRLAQEVFDTIGKDLEGIVIRTGNKYEWLLIQESNNSGVDNGVASKEMVNPLEISFFSAVTDRYNGQINHPTEDRGGDISMIRYRLIQKDLIGAAKEKPVFALYRQRIEPKEAFDDFLAKESIDEDSNEINGYDTDQIVEDKNYLAENIYDFTLSFIFEYTLNNKKGYKRVVVQTNGDVKGLRIKGNVIEIKDGASWKPLNEEIPTGASQARLSGADISILVLSDSAMNKLANDKTPSFSEDELAKFLLKNGHHYSKSVILPQP